MNTPREGGEQSLPINEEQKPNLIINKQGDSVSVPVGSPVNQEEHASEKNNINEPDQKSQSVSGEELGEDNPTKPTEEEKNIGEIPEERAEIIDLSKKELIKLNPDLLKEKDSKGFISELGDDAAERIKAELLDEETLQHIASEAEKQAILDAQSEGRVATDLDKQKAREIATQKATEEAEKKAQEAKQKAEKEGNIWLKRAQEFAGITFDKFKEANEGASMDKFIDLFLVFGVDGKFGSGVAIFNEKEATDGDKILRSKIEGKSKEFVKAMNEALYYNIRQEGGTMPDFLNLNTDEAAKDPQALYKAVKYFNQISASPGGWQSLQKGLSKFCDGQYEFGLETQKLFSSLESISAIKQFLQIDSVEDSGETDKSSQSDQQAKDTQAV